MNETVEMIVPVSAEFLEDNGEVSERLRPYLVLQSQRTWTMIVFDEDWSGPEQELDRLEHRGRLRWDPRYWPDEFEEDEW